MGLLLWSGLGAAIGYMAARHRGFSWAKGVAAGVLLGPLACVLFFVPDMVVQDVPDRKCPYCTSSVAADTRVCAQCHAILTSGWESRE